MNKKWFAIILAIGFIGCKKDNVPANQPSIGDITDPVTAVAPVAITVKIDETKHICNIPPFFEGLSYETGLLTNSPEFLNENNAVLIQLIKNLGKGILRIGGNTSDEIDWAGGASTAATPTNVLTNTDVDHLSAFAKAIGWPVLYNLNLADNQSAAAAKEALYVTNSIQSNLLAFQIGNEPDVFNLKLRPSTYNYKNFEQEWGNYFTAVRKTVPQSRFAGPDTDPFDPSWVSNFAADEGKNVKMLDAHYYNTGPASNAAINYQDILMPDPKLDGFLVQLGKISATYRLPFRISECNSVWGGGKPGVSDTFASALWALDFMWDVAQNKGDGVNFHGGPPRFAYTPITMDSTSVTAKPEYYAMLAFKYGSAGSAMIPATIQDPRIGNNCSVYACISPDNTYSITLINKDIKPFSFTVQLDNAVTNIQIARLKAPGITATTGVTYAGSSVNADGTFTPAASTSHAVNSKSFVITVPAGSAAVVTAK